MEKKTNEEKMMDVKDYLKAIAEEPMPVGTKLSFEVKEHTGGNIYTVGVEMKGTIFP